VRSLPDAVARALELDLARQSMAKAAEVPTPANPPSEPSEHTANGHATGASVAATAALRTVTGNLCPQCGCNTMVYEEGCKKCHSCGHSEC
jgi:ribonucleoside-diphosphate reductase alpha chain